MAANMDKIADFDLYSEEATKTTLKSGIEVEVFGCECQGTVGMTVTFPNGITVDIFASDDRSVTHDGDGSGCSATDTP